MQEGRIFVFCSQACSDVNDANSFSGVDIVAVTDQFISSKT